VSEPAAVRDLIARATFPLFAIPPAAWDGPSLVGSFTTEGERVRDIQFVYLDQIDERSMGICVGNIDGAAKVPDAVEIHLVNFVARFDDEYLVSRVKRRRFEPFPPSDFRVVTQTVALAGRTVGASMYTHTTLPLRLLRAPVRIGSTITDVGIAGWRLDPLDHLAKVVPVDVTVATAFDAARPREIRLDDDG
jgi:hypothetical protein